MTEPRKPEQSASSMGIKYALVAAFILLVGIVAYMSITSLRPMWDSLVVIGGLIGFGGTSFWSIMSFLKSEDGRAQSRQTYFQVNDRMDQFKKELEEKMQRMVREGYAAGLKDGSQGTIGIPHPVELIQKPTEPKT